MTAVSPWLLRTGLVLTAFLLAGCVSGPDDDLAASTGEVSSEPADDTAATTTAAETTETAPLSTSTTTTTTTTSVAVSEAFAYISSFDPDRGSDLHRLIGDEVEPVTALVLADTGAPVQLTDLALSVEGVLYGSTFTELVRIDPSSGDVESVEPFSRGEINALTFLPDGRLLAADLDGRVSIVDVETGEAEMVATYPSGLVSSGDLAVLPDGTVVATATDDVSEFLLAIDLTTGNTEILSTGLPPAVYGLVVAPEGGLLGLTFVSVSGHCPQGELIALEPGGSGYEPLRCLDFTPGGAAGG